MPYRGLPPSEHLSRFARRMAGDVREPVTAATPWNVVAMLSGHADAKKHIDETLSPQPEEPTLEPLSTPRPPQTDTEVLHDDPPSPPPLR